MRAELALIGYGNVARRFETMLAEQRAALANYGLDCRIVATASRRHGCTAGGAPCADAFEAIAHVGRSDAHLKVVIETTTLDIKSGEPAIAHVRAAFAAGCHVVTANKGPVAFAYHELDATARAAGVRFLFEGSVMDGIPIFNLVRETMPALEIRGFEGVINTTTNHILAAMEEGEEFEAALAHMQAQGIAEADASLDVDGWDAAAKAAALANVLLAARITPHDVEREGITPAMAARARTALANGGRLKLVASARRGDGGRVVARVEPRELPQDHLLAGLAGEANAVIFETDLLNKVAITQLSSSLTQTAYALLSDLITISRQR
jgi:homoserine dehydrogenase